MKKKTIAFIGGGNMATSLLGGLIDYGYDPHYLWISDHHPERLSFLREKFACHTSQDNIEAADNADIIVFAVKPNAMQEVVTQLGTTLRKRNPLIISIAAGIREARIRQWVGSDIAIVRCMPNTPALVRCGATGMHANTLVTSEQRELAEEILRAVGIVTWVQDEHMLDAITALSGSGPAYFFLVMEALEDAAKQLGLPEDMTRLLTQQTALGAARMAMESNESPHQLRQRVTSPGGTTESALKVFEEANLRSIFDKAVHAAQKRAIEIGDSS